MAPYLLAFGKQLASTRNRADRPSSSCSSHFSIEGFRRLRGPIPRWREDAPLAARSVRVYLRRTRFGGRMEGTLRMALRHGVFRRLLVSIGLAAALAMSVETGLATAGSYDPSRSTRTRWTPWWRRSAWTRSGQPASPAAVSTSRSSTPASRRYPGSTRRGRSSTARISRSSRRQQTYPASTRTATGRSWPA